MGLSFFFCLYFFLRLREEAGRKDRDRRWRQRRRGDGENEGFMISSWSRVRSSWPGDLLCSGLLRASDPAAKRSSVFLLPAFADITVLLCNAAISR